VIFVVALVAVGIRGWDPVAAGTSATGAASCAGG
jgi:hypothetical protein